MVKIAGVLLALLILLPVGFLVIDSMREQAALDKARAKAEWSEEQARLDDRLYREKLHLIGLVIGPAAEAYWRTKQTEVQQCEALGSPGPNGAKPPRCVKLLAEFNKIERRASAGTQ